MFISFLKKHMKKSGRLFLLLSLILLCAFLLSEIFAFIEVIPDYNPSHNYMSDYAGTDKEIEASFPASYQSALKSLLHTHPNYRFRAYNTGYDFEGSVLIEEYPGRNLTYYQDFGGLGICSSWYSTEIEGSYNWAGNFWTPYDSGLWYQSSEEAIRYCMDPRNFLTESQIFQFLEGNAFIENNAALTSALQNEFNTVSPFWIQPADKTDLYYLIDVENPAYAEYLKKHAEWEERQKQSESGSGSESGAGSGSASSGTSSPETVSDPEPVAPEKTIEKKQYLTYAEALASLNVYLSDRSFLSRQGITVSDSTFAAIKQGGLSQAMVVSRLLQEQGAGESPLISGTRKFTLTYGDRAGEQIDGGYYNYFNIGAFGDGTEEIYNNGLTEAYEEGWNTRFRALVGGAIKFYEKYLKAGQSTLYFQKFNPIASSGRAFWGQYMGNITAPQTECLRLRTLSPANHETPIYFTIPVYDNMPSVPSKKPTVDGNPNYKLGSLYVDGTSLKDFHPDRLQPYDTVITENAFMNISVIPYAPLTTAVAIVADYDDGTRYVSDITKSGNASSGTLPLRYGTQSVSVITRAENGTMVAYTFPVERKIDSQLRSVSVDRKAFADFRPELLLYSLSSGAESIPFSVIPFHPDDVTVSAALASDPPETLPVTRNGNSFDFTVPLRSSDQTLIVRSVSKSGQSSEYQFQIHRNMTPEEPEKDPMYYGDINKDHLWNVLDAAEIFRHILEYTTLTGEDFERADINGDKAVNVLDAAEIFRYILGYQKTVPQRK